MPIKQPKIETSPEDEFLYIQLTRLLEQIKLTRGGTELAYTLRNHKDIRLYLISKQIEKIRHIEETYFNDDGTLNYNAIHDHYLSKSRSLQSL